MATNVDLLGPLVSESFANVAATGTASFPTSGAPLTASAKLITGTISYNAANQNYSLTVDGRSQTFRPSDIDASQSNSLITVYVRTSGNTSDSLTVTKPGTSGTLTYKYVGSAFWQRQTNGADTITGSFDALAYGIVTPNAGVPRTGQANYSVDLLGAITQPGAVVGIVGDGAFQADFASGRIVGNIAIGRTGGTTGVWQGTAQISSASNAFTGTFGATIGFGLNNIYAGSLNGAFFGPAANELGAAFQGRSGDGNIVVGTVMGRTTATGGNADLVTLTNPQFFAGSSARVAFDRTGDTTAATGVTSSQSAMIVGFDPASSFTGARFNFFFPDRASGQRSTPDQYDFASSPFYAGLISIPSAGWVQFSNDTNRYLKAGRFISASGNHVVFDDFVFGLPTAGSAVPVTGTAGYVLNLRGTEFGPSAAPQALTGNGTLVLDFATGTLTATGAVSGNYNNIFYGAFNATGHLGSSSPAFNGAWNVSGGSSAYTGTWNGSLYGPAGQEVGAQFQADSGAGSKLNGVLFGTRNDDVVPNTTGLKDLTVATTLHGALGFAYGYPGHNRWDSSNATFNQDPFIAVDFDPATGTYKFRSESTDNLGAPRIDLTFASGNIDAAHSDSSFVAYSSADGKSEARILRLSGSGRVVDLTYSNVALLVDRNPDRNDSGRTSRYFATYGLMTPELQMPRTGTASYAGHAWGGGWVNATGAVNGDGFDASIEGTMTAQMNFNNGTIGVTLRDLLASDPTGAFASRNLGDFLLEGSRFVNTFSGGGNASGYSYAFNGKFYGPNAAEIGGAFNLSRDLPAGYSPDFKISGVFAGKKN